MAAFPFSELVSPRILPLEPSRIYHVPMIDFAINNVYHRQKELDHLSIVSSSSERTIERGGPEHGAQKGGQFLANGSVGTDSCRRERLVESSRLR